ncbi:hypothetical protein BC938DRAFT_481072, partial [Jimgerdemannia flammicorona]
NCTAHSGASHPTSHQRSHQAVLNQV